MTLKPTNGLHLLASLGDPANFNGFHVLALLLQRRHSLTKRQPNFEWCLAISWAATLYIHFWGSLAPDIIFSGAKFTLRPSLAFSYIGSITAQHSSSGHQPNFVAWYKEWNHRIFCRGRHLYSAGRPSRWASGHILVIWGVKLCLFHSWQSYRNVELDLMQFIVCVYGTISVPFNREAVIMRIRSIFQLILAVDFMEFYFTKTHILLEPEWRTSVPHIPGCVPPWRQIDAYVCYHTV